MTVNALSTSGPQTLGPGPGTGRVVFVLFFLLSQVFEESLFQMRFVSVGCSQVEVK